MVKYGLTILVIIAAFISSMFIVGCQSDAQTGALLGTAAGAGIGQLAGGSTEATLIGGAIGAGVGYIVGNESDKNKTRESQSASAPDSSNTETVWVTNSNNSKTQVKLTKQGTGYVGPKGEYYDHLPSSDELKPAYGF